MHSIEIRIPKVDSDGSDCKAKALRATPNYGGRFERVNKWSDFPGRRPIP